MNPFPEGNAVIYCEGAFGTTNGKTAHGLVRRTRRYRVLSVIDSKKAASDAGEVLDGEPNGVMIHPDLRTAIQAASRESFPASHFVIGLAPDGGRLSPEHRKAVIEAIKSGLNVDSGLHDFLSEDEETAALAVNHEHLSREEIPAVCAALSEKTGLPAVDVLLQGAGELVRAARPYIKNR